MAITEETLTLARDVRQRIAGLSDRQVVALTRAWVDAWGVLGPDLEETLTGILRASGTDTVTRAQLARQRQLTAALERARGTLEELARATDDVVTRDLLGIVDAAADDLGAIGRSQLPPGQNTATVGIAFERPAAESLDAIVARSTERIHAATIPLPDDVVTLMRGELVRGVAVGDNPRTTARRMVRGAEGRFNGGLARATNIARTETLDAHRYASRETAIQNVDILSGWVWTANLDARTCISCLVQNGTEHPIDEFGPIDHQQGRCYRVDKTRSWRELGFDINEPADETPDAHAWFDNLTPDSQRAIMGPERLRLYQSGEASWDDMSRLRKTDGWRDSMVPTPVRDLIPSQ